MDDLVDDLHASASYLRDMFDGALARDVERIERAASAIEQLQRQLAEAVANEREACAKVCEDQQKVFASTQYAAGQPMSSFGERFACGQCAAAIRERTD